MNNRRPWLGTAAITFAVALGCLTSSLTAQTELIDRLPPAIVIAQNITPEQMQVIDQYVTGWSEQLLAGDDEAVTTARKRLMEPMGATATEAFTNRYGQLVAPTLSKAMNDDKLIVRLNAMIVVTRLTADTAVDLIVRGLNDESPAVRYWAVKAVRSVADRSPLSVPQQLKLLPELTGLLKREQTTAVVQELMVSIGTLEVPAATQELLEALNGRVVFHMKNAGESILAEQKGLQRLYLKLVAASSAQGATEQEIRQIARVAMRFMDLAALRLDEGKIPTEHRDGYEQLLTLTDAVLRFAHENLYSPRRRPAEIDNAVRVGDWKFVRVQVDQWKTILREPPFSFSEAQLDLNNAD